MAYKQFEYSHENTRDMSFEKYKQLLDEKGLEGWELCHSVFMNTITFKREIPTKLPVEPPTKEWWERIKNLNSNAERNA